MHVSSPIWNCVIKYFHNNCYILLLKSIDPFLLSWTEFCDKAIEIRLVTVIHVISKCSVGVAVSYYSNDKIIIGSLFFSKWWQGGSVGIFHCGLFKVFLNEFYGARICFKLKGKTSFTSSLWPHSLWLSDWRCVGVFPAENRGYVSIAYLKTLHKQNFFVSGTKFKFPSLQHLSQRGSTPKAISLYFPKDHLHRDDICLLFVLFLMLNLYPK